MRTIHTFAKSYNLIRNKLQYSHVTFSEIQEKHCEENRVEAGWQKRGCYNILGEFGTDLVTGHDATNSNLKQTHRKLRFRQKVIIGKV